MRAGTLDVLIRGGGPVGCTLALALRRSGMSIGIIQASPTRVAHFRPIALSHGSRLILERIGAWAALAPTAINAIHVSQAGGFGRTRLDAADAGVPALGYVVEYDALAQALQAACADLIIPGALPARCIVHAEGVAADAGERRYAQDALVGLVTTDPVAHGMAFERFTAEGPLALLPLADRYALIWSMPPERARALTCASEADFLAALARAAGSLAGTPVAVTARFVQPLVLRVRSARVAARAVYIGNAAQTLHPVAGQGLNLGLRDAWELAATLQAADADPGDAAVLARYCERRRLDASATIGMTHLLAAGFTGSNRLLRAARGAALTALDMLPGPRRFFARRMIYGASALP
jgi:2-octaprenyl-6-methoxyphenol hydroxylase